MHEYEADILDAVAGLEAESFAEPWKLEDIEITLKYDYNHLIYIRAEDDTVAGYVIYSTVADESELLRIAVGKGYRKKGYGNLLVRSYCDEAKKTACRSFLEVRATNDAAIALYVKNDYKKIAVRKNYYSNPLCDAYIFAKQLP